MASDARAVSDSRTDYRSTTMRAPLRCNEHPRGIRPFHVVQPRQLGHVHAAVQQRLHDGGLAAVQQRAVHGLLASVLVDAAVATLTRVVVMVDW